MLFVSISVSVEITEDIIFGATVAVLLISNIFYQVSNSSISNIKKKNKIKLFPDKKGSMNLHGHLFCENAS